MVTFRAMKRRPIILLLFFASGFSGLVYEVVWMRHLSVVFGSTVYASATVLAGFMGGLALGSFFLGRVADRVRNPLGMYAVLELLIAICGVAFPFVLRLLTPAYIWSARTLSDSHYVLSLIQAALIILIIIVPTVFMGGTLPALTRYLSRSLSALGSNLSLLYGLNTLGAVAGCASAGFVLIGKFGLRATTAVAVIMNVAVGLAALLLARQAAPEEREPAPAAEEAVEPCPPWLPRLLLVLFALSGFTALAYEVLWMRVLVFLTGGTTYAFTAMLTTYLCGLAIGSTIIARVAGLSRRLLGIFGLLEFLIGLGVLATLILCPVILSALGGLLFREEGLNVSRFAAFATSQAVLSFAFIFPFTLLFGMAFPIVGRLYTRSLRAVGRGVGTVYFADTLGAIAGSLAAGFILIPRLGTLRSLEGIALVNIVVGALALSPSGETKPTDRFIPRRFIVLLALGIAAWLGCWRSIPKDTFAQVFTMPGSRLLYVSEDIGGTVTLEDYGTHRTLSINGINVAGTDLKFLTTQKLQAHLGLLLHPHPRKVLQIGFGSGGTAWTITRHPVEQIDCVEIAPAIIRARHLLREVNHGVLEADDRVRVFIDDARSYLLKCGKYDAILSDSIHPRREGNGSLYSTDYFELCREKLNPDGIFSAWLPFYGLSLEDFRVAARSLRAVFPHVYLFHTPVGRNEWTIILGTLQPLRMDVEALSRKLARPEVREDLAEILMDREQAVLDCFLIGDGTLSAFLGPSKTLNTYDFPYLEYVAPISAFVESRDELIVPVYEELVRCREPVGPYVVNPGPLTAAGMDRAYRSFSHTLEARMIELRQGLHAPAAIEELDKALELDPDNAVARDLLR
ncbi:MAG: fused MFS/spermidine synthase [Kiritimatiellae bacterium]|nr:fused MFS/spermidine synthase [Kiritimatiellia bacterium]